MTRGQRLSAAIALAAAVLLIGRGAAVIYVRREWFSNLGAGSIWQEEVLDVSLLYGVATLIAIAFAWLNISAVRRSVASLIVPKRMGNVEFGEEVISVRLRLVTFATSLAISLVSLAALPSWTAIALWRSGVVFGESDPYFNLDLGVFVAWLPVEFAAFEWCIALFAITSATVVTLYALTPGLRWGKGGLTISPYARRHIAVLGAILLLFVAWQFRLDAFRTLIHGNGDGGVFTRLDHVWLVPTDLALSLLTIGAAVVLLAAGWMGQTVTSFVTVTIILVASGLSQLLLPQISARSAKLPGATGAEEPYRETRDSYTLRAFPVEQTPLALRLAADSTLLANAGRVVIRNAPPQVVFPGAVGTFVVPDSPRLRVAPRLGSGLTRLMHAWADQNPRLLRDDLDASDAYVRERDIRDRVRALTPVFAQSGPIGASQTARGVLWIVDLYSTSATYPLSANRTLRGAPIAYRHHAATAFVSGGTGATLVVPDSALDPIARAWFGTHPGRYMTDVLPPALTQPPPPATPAASTSSPTDVAFRADVTRIYRRMRAALDSADLRDFGIAFDSLGLLVRDAKAQPQPPAHP